MTVTLKETSCKEKKFTDRDETLVTLNNGRDDSKNSKHKPNSRYRIK